MSQISPVVRLMRPQQWLKNFLVFAAPLSAELITDYSTLRSSTLLFISFCLVSSSLYAVNDIRDREEDKNHPRKKLRPVASGELSLKTASIIAALLMLVGLSICFASLSITTFTWLVIYVANTLLYNILFRSTAVVDLLSVSFGFLVRAVAGAVVVSVPLSPWFILCISFGALFVISGKRFAELKMRSSLPAEGRRSLESYSVEFLRTATTISSSIAVICYCIWALDESITSLSSQLSILPMIGIFLRYLLLLDSGEGEAPEDIFSKDLPILFFGCLWLILFSVVIYS